MNFWNIVLGIALGFCLSIKAQPNLLKKAKAFTNSDSAMHYAEMFYKESCRNNDTLMIIEGGYHLTKLYRNKGLYKDMEQLITQIMPLAVIKNKTLTQIGLYQCLSVKAEDMSDMTHALEYKLKAQELSEKLNDQEAILTSSINLAEFYRKMRRFKDAKTLIYKAHEIYKKANISNTNYIIPLFNRMAAIMIESGNVDSCIYFSNKALELSRQTKNKLGEARSLNEKGMAFKQSSRPDSAIFCYRSAEQIWRKSGEFTDLALVLNNLASVYAENGYPDNLVLKINSELINLVTGKKLLFPLEEAYQALAKVYSKTGDYKKANFYLQKYYESKMVSLKKVYDVAVSDLEEKYENEKIKKEYSQVNSELKNSQLVLSQKKREAIIIYTFIVVLLMLMIMVIYLLLRIRQSNKVLLLKNTEKDVLIQEIHHRVKNNLQFVSSLINMQINSSDNSAEAYSLNDASRRIKAMALVHEMLYNQNEMQGINIRQYLLELVESMNELVNSKEIPIQFRVESDSLIFDTQKAIAIGMITSELVSNSIKYAFTKTENPQIVITLTKQVDTIAYSVQDNGIGFNETNEQRKKLGMRLISIFSRQLKGKYSFENKNGYAYTIQFKHQ